MWKQYHRNILWAPLRFLCRTFLQLFVFIRPAQIKIKTSSWEYITHEFLLTANVVWCLFFYCRRRKQAARQPTPVRVYFFSWSCEANLLLLKELVTRVAIKRWHATSVNTARWKGMPVLIRSCIAKGKVHLNKDASNTRFRGLFWKSGSFSRPSRIIGFHYSVSLQPRAGHIEYFSRSHRSSWYAWASRWIGKMHGLENIQESKWTRSRVNWTCLKFWAECRVNGSTCCNWRQAKRNVQKKDNINTDKKKPNSSRRIIKPK